MIYLKLFQNSTEYNAYTADTANFIKPNVSLTVDNNSLHYNPSTPTPSHEYVDLGLPSGTKWATMNVGANSITDYGNYYQYGKGAATYQETSGDTDYEGREITLAASADTATQVWGDSWHMPTVAQLQELRDNTTYEWTTINGVNGGKFTATNGNYVFFPAAGYWYDGSHEDVGEFGGYWGSTTVSKNRASYHLYFYDGNYDVSYDERKNGYSVRPVVG